MITKTVIKDYVAKRCPYLVSMEIEDTNLVKLLKESIEVQEKYLELVKEQQEESNSSEPEEMFNLVEVMKDYPHLSPEIKKLSKKRELNKAEQLIEKYNDDQIVSTLSRRYFELQYGVDKCARCDINADGKTLIMQDAILSLTDQYLKDPNIKVIFEGQIEFNELRARFDVLIKNDDGTYSLIEVKGTNSVFKTKSSDSSIDTGIKDKYLYDLLFQYYVYSKAGLNISSLAYMYTNRDFEMKVPSYPTDDSDLNDLFIVKSIINLADGAMSLIKYFDGDYYVPKKAEDPDYYTIEGIIASIRDIAKLSSTSPEMRYECVKGPTCPFTKMCFDDAADNEDSLFRLTRWGNNGGYWGKTKELLDMGLTKMSEIPDNYTRFPKITEKEKRSNAHTQIEFQKGRIKEKYVIDIPRLEEILLRDYLNVKIDYLLFFDFESFQYPIPLVKHSPAWKQIVSQYSMHVVKKGYDLAKHDFPKGCGGGITHFEFIANPDQTKYENPSVLLYETLKSQLISADIDPMASNYRVVVFNDNFEKTRMKEFWEDFVGKVDLDLIQFVKNFHANVVDLLDFFTSGALYSREFHGRGSLKVVQPRLAEDQDVIDFYKKSLPYDLAYTLDYHKGDKCLVYNGGICLDLYKSLLVRSHLGGAKANEPTTDELLAEALAYCKIDSWGTVILYDIVKNVYFGNLKLDAKFDH